jgi:hypothetical protein
MPEHLGESLNEEPVEEWEIDDETEKIDVARQKRDELRSIFIEAEATDDQKKKVLVYTEWAKKQLEKDLDISDLSTIEGVHLKNTVEKLLPQFEKERKLISKKKMSDVAGFDMEEETAVLWLYETYGIHEKDIPRVFLVEDETDNKIYTFEQIQEDAAKEKYKQLIDVGHDVYVLFRVPDDFKEHLRRLREEAHHDA